jgi:hypothetical protein
MSVGVEPGLVDPETWDIVSQPAVSSAVARGRKIAEEKHYTLVDSLKLIILKYVPFPSSANKI